MTEFDDFNKAWVEFEKNLGIALNKYKVDPKKFDPEKLKEILKKLDDTKKVIEDLLRVVEPALRAYITRRGYVFSHGYYKWAKDWLNWLEGRKTWLEEQKSWLIKEIPKAPGQIKPTGVREPPTEETEIKELAEEWWNGAGGIKKELEDSLKLLDEILSYWSYDTPAGGVMTKTLRNYLNSVRDSQIKFMKECENLTITTRNPKYFEENFDPIYKKLNIIGLLNAQREFLNLLQSFDSFASSEKRKQIPGLTKSYQEELDALYKDIVELSEKFKKDVKYIKTVNLDGLMTETSRIIEKKK